ncbi:MAG: hypothetical protein ACP6IY_09775 [Promethearchaeia archaeon]
MEKNEINRNLGRSKKLIILICSISILAINFILITLLTLAMNEGTPYDFLLYYHMTKFEAIGFSLTKEYSLLFTPSLCLFITFTSRIKYDIKILICQLILFISIFAIFFNLILTNILAASTNLVQESSMLTALSNTLIAFGIMALILTLILFIIFTLEAKK